MAFEIIRPSSYAKREKKFFKKHPELIKQYVKTLKLLSLNPQHPSLRLPKTAESPTACGEGWIAEVA